ncbi:alkaline phosphatase [Cellvibrio zantedeschiae]|uniref:Alkaline phosphatase n=1 Tax=Cellvibrio zantedeschiae TaxID=1237077 RepID=A0ABQ3AS40_9GAMM|nr:alkaline phosphatase [Cellvibrio zantedeschiae]GGY64864.1 alkaline phosphatase [Cellvibrio zantedeschiae]
MHKLTLVLLACILCTSVRAAEPNTNIIFLIGDGMGVAYTGAYRLYQDDLTTPELDATIFDEMLVGMASTYPDDHNQVTDSAAAATALATGVKTYNGAIGVNAQRSPVVSVLDKAKELGYLTGIAVTCQVNHATPAAFVAHADSRQSYEKIADQYMDLKIHGKPKVDVIFGGGQEYFVRKDRNLAKEFEALGYSYNADIKDLSKIKKLPALGLFSKGGLTPALESEHPLRLVEMTEKSLELLSAKSAQKKPFLLMLEASQIDWCGHANDIACAMGEMRDMAETMKLIKRFIDKNPNTIFVATADHSTGGLSVGAKGQYQWNAAVVRNIKATAPTIARQLLASKSNWKSVWQSLTQIKLADDEQKTLDAFITQADENNSELVVGQLTAQVLNYIDKYTSTGWTTKGHTGEYVQVFSYGKGKNNFEGAIDNTDIAKKLFNYLK